MPLPHTASPQCPLTPLNRHKCATTAKILSDDNIIRQQSFVGLFNYTHTRIKTIYVPVYSSISVIIAFHSEKLFPSTTVVSHTSSCIGEKNNTKRQIRTTNNIIHCNRPFRTTLYSALYTIVGRTRNDTRIEKKTEFRDT